jgi:hypothetical protein
MIDMKLPADWPYEPILDAYDLMSADEFINAAKPDTEEQLMRRHIMESREAE